MVRCQAATSTHMLLLIARLEPQRESTILPNQINLVDSLLPRTVRCLYITIFPLSQHAIQGHVAVHMHVTPVTCGSNNSVSLRACPGSRDLSWIGPPA